jgi:hypothetical protein
MAVKNHEDFSRAEESTPGSDRAFGLVMTAAFAGLAAMNGWHHGRVWPLMAGIAVLFLGLALLRPAMLHPLNRAWFKFGLLLHKIVNPIIMGVVFYGTVLPIGLFMRASGKDLLRLKLKPEEDTYWLVRKPPGPAPITMADQF